MAIKRSIRLGFVRHLRDNEYVVQEVVNSTAYYPGQTLSEEETTRLCNNHGWTVRIVPNKAVAA